MNQQLDSRNYIFTLCEAINLPLLLKIKQFENKALRLI